MNALPTDAQERKRHPMYSGLVAYFPKALAAVSHLSWLGNEQHHPGTPLHWDKSKSSDELDALMRHLTDEEWVHVAWRALANLERKLDAGWQPWAGHNDMVVISDGADQQSIKITYKQALEQIARKNDPPEVKAGLPKLPDGWVYAGFGPLKVSNKIDGWIYSQDIAAIGRSGWGGWDFTGWNGDSDHHYALRRGSEIAKLNGL